MAWPMQVLQDDYNEALNGTSNRTVADVLSSYEGTQVAFPSHSPRHQAAIAARSAEQRLAVSLGQ